MSKERTLYKEQVSSKFLQNKQRKPRTIKPRVVNKQASINKYNNLVAKCFENN